MPLDPLSNSDSVRSVDLGEGSIPSRLLTCLSQTVSTVVLVCAAVCAFGPPVLGQGHTLGCGFCGSMVWLLGVCGGLLALRPFVAGCCLWFPCFFGEFVWAGYRHWPVVSVFFGEFLAPCVCLRQTLA